LGWCLAARTLRAFTTTFATTATLTRTATATTTFTTASSETTATATTSVTTLGADSCGLLGVLFEPVSKLGEWGLDVLGSGPEIWGEELVGVGNGVEASLDEVL